MVGPVIGAWFAAEAGIRVMFWGTALCFLAQIIPLGALNVDALPVRQSATPPSTGLAPSQWSAMTPLLIFTGLYALVYAGEAIKYGFLLLYMEE